MDIKDKTFAFWRLLLVFSFMAPSVVFSAEISVIGSPIFDTDRHCDFRMPAETFALALPQLAKNKVDRCQYIVHIEGLIEKKDPNIIKELQIAQRKLYIMGISKAPPPLWVSLNSNGGNIIAAIEVGYLLRDGWSMPTSTRVQPDQSCLSACVFLLAAGNEKEPVGNVGIHRPRFTNFETENLSANSLEKHYDNLYILIKNYLEYLNIHPDFLDDLWSIPSQDIKILTFDDLKKYRLLGKDLVLGEMEDLEIIERCGEKAPQLRDDFFNQYREECSEDDGLECLHRLVESHPHGDCLKRM